MQNRKNSLIVYRVLAVVVLAAMLAVSSGPVMADPLSFTLSGHVFYQGTTNPVADAAVLALQNTSTALKVSGLTNSAGAYSLTLPAAGDWQVVVLPHEADPAHSPDWVYTAGTQTVTVSASTTLDLTVTPTAATVTGQLLVPVPDQPATFTGANLAAVRAVNQEGQGNTVQVTADGHFSVNVLAGDVQVRLALKNALWSPDPTLAGSVWTVASGDTLALPTATDSAALLQLLKKQASISGTVLDEHAAPVPNIPIRAWRLDASEAATTTSASDGTYSLNLVSGVWEIWAIPSDTDGYVSAESPHTVRLLTPTATAAVVLHVVTADITVTGTVVDQNGAAVVPGPNGHVLPTYLDKDGIHWRQFANGAPITNGTFTLKLSSAEASHFRLHASFPNLQGYTEIFAPKLDLVPGTTSYVVTLPIAQDNSKITGHLVDQSNTPKTGLAGAIYGASDGGAFARRRVNPVDASYEFDVAASALNGNGGTTWWLHAFVDPTSTYTVIRPRTQKVFLPDNNGAGTNVDNINFTVVQVNAAIHGLVTDPQGLPIAGAKVGVWEQNTTSGLAFTRWIETGKDGRYVLPVPAGTYKIGADFLRWISPVPVKVTAAAGDNAKVDLQFRAFDATISGTVTYADGANPAQPHVAMVRAFTKDGAHTWALAGADGKYTLKVNAVDTWTIQAVSEEGASFLKSAPLTLLTGAGKNPGNDLLLVKSDDLPAAVVFNFDATTDQVLTLSDGAQVIIPANAMATSGNVTVIVRPLPEVADDGVAAPVSFGYRLTAFDSFNTPIDHFNTPVTLVMPYTAAQLTALGVTPASLIPSYWDLSSNSFKPVPDYSVTQASDGSGSLNLSVMHFTDYALLAAANPAYITSGPFTTFLPAVTGQ